MLFEISDCVRQDDGSYVFYTSEGELLLTWDDDIAVAAFDSGAWDFGPEVEVVKDDIDDDDDVVECLWNKEWSSQRSSLSSPYPWITMWPYFGRKLMNDERSIVLDFDEYGQYEVEIEMVCPDLRKSFKFVFNL